MKRDLIKKIFDEIHSKPPRKNYPMNKIIYNHFDEKWIIDLMDKSHFKNFLKKGFRYMIIIIDSFSKYTWVIPLKNRIPQLVTVKLSNILITSKRSTIKIESDGGKKFYNTILQDILKVVKIHHCSRFTDEGASIAEKVIRTIRNSIKKPVFDKSNAN